MWHPLLPTVRDGNSFFLLCYGGCVRVRVCVPTMSEKIIKVLRSIWYISIMCNTSYVFLCYYLFDFYEGANAVGKRWHTVVTAYAKPVCTSKHIYIYIYVDVYCLTVLYLRRVYRYRGPRN